MHVVQQRRGVDERLNLLQVLTLEQFTVPVGNADTPVEWAVDVVLPDGGVKQGVWTPLKR